MSEKGWITLHRKVLKHFVFDDRPYNRAAAWIDILLTVNWKQSEVVIGNKHFTCERGQSLLSIESWAKRWGWNKSATRRFIILLVKSGMIRTANETVTIRLTVCKYDDYQNVGTGSEPEMNSTRNASELEVTPIEQDNNVTSKQGGDTAPNKARPKDIAEVAEYFRSIQVPTTESESFMDHYIANGWVQGKNKPIKDWKATARNWKRNMEKYGNNGTTKKSESDYLKHLK